MPSKNLINARVALLVSDPWEFGTECGTDTFFGTIKDLDGEKALILLDKKISYGGADYYTCVCTPRHQGKDIADILNGENVADNMMLISTNATSFYDVNQQGPSKTLAVIGTVRLSSASARDRVTRHGQA